MTQQNYSIIPPTGAVGITNPNLPQGKNGGISAAGWTYGNEGFVQQTFLGASIRNFNVVAGFGDTSSTLTVDLINDEYNVSDKTGLGIGDDVYHNGKGDLFKPPPVGSPVFFKFGKNHATIEQAWRRYFDVTYKKFTIPIEQYLEPSLVNVTDPNLAIANGYVYDIENKAWRDLSNKKVNDDLEYAGDTGDSQPSDKYFARGKDHFVFGGILQSYTQNRSTNGNPLYSVQVVDPREILSSVQVILNNYTGSMFKNKNFINVYGFLEYDISDGLQNLIDDNALPGFSQSPIEDPALWSPIGTNKLKKIQLPLNKFSYQGTDIYRFSKETTEKDDFIFPEFFPMTGEGMSRRCDQGIPWYRVRQALDAIFEIRGKELPKEYKDAGFGTQIDFRGFNYVVDFSGLPLEKIPQMYFLDFDQLDLLSLMQEICDVISHDLYVTLLPVINHPACLDLYKKNEQYIKEKNYNKIVAGIIRVEAINRSDSPSVGAIKDYIEVLKTVKNIQVENQDLGYELSNVTTDKIVAGAQEVNIYFFESTYDRDENITRLKNAGFLTRENVKKIEKEQWTLQSSLSQQIIPFYGFIGKNIPTIPRGWGAYQQILLDATGLDAHGVGRYYIATEMELRAAMISYEQWARFLLQYNETYIEEYGENSIFYRELYSELEPGARPDITSKELLEDNPPAWYIENRKFGVSVPRCVFISEQNYMGEDGYPASPCSPPFGYPLYYKRAEKIGIPEAGVVKYQNAVVETIINYERLLAEADGTEDLIQLYNEQIDQQINRDIVYISKQFAGTLSEEEYIQWIADYNEIRRQAQQIKTLKDLQKNVALIRETLSDNKSIKLINQLSKKHLKNAKKVYQFVKAIAEENLGKKFLVKIPRATNLNWHNKKEYSNEFFGIQFSELNLSPAGFNPNFPSDDINTGYKNNGYKELEKISTIQDYENEFWFDEFKNAFLRNGNSERWYPRFIEEQDRIETKQKLFSSAIYLYDDNSRQEFKFLDMYQNYVIKNHDTYDDLMKKCLHEEYRFWFNGALKINFNPISDKWEFNYKPEPQGGFYDYKILPLWKYNQLAISGIPSVSEGLVPSDLTNFTSNGRITAYVRYDHSEYLDLSSVGRDNLYQASAENMGIADVMEELNNVDIDNSQSFDSIAELTNENDGNKKNAFVAFVKCDLDEQLYMIPKTIWGQTLVFGRQTEWVPNARSLKKIETTDANGCKKMVPAKPYPMPIWTVSNKKGPGGSDGTLAEILEFARKLDNPKEKNELKQIHLIDTLNSNLDPWNVYALITIPGRIIPTIDKRYHDGPYKAINGADMAHLLTQDTTHAPDDFKFNFPDEIQGKETPLDCKKFTFNQLTNAQKIQKIVLQNLSFADPQINIGFTQPSPVYPNLVAIPLLSTERCYGPWFSASAVNGYSNSGIRYKNIGGRVEFVKDENLAPWNYGGYDLMKEAGNLQAQFSNSLLLFSERGSITYPDAPSNVDLAKPLNYGGPLITSISVDVNESSIKTSIKMDLYTSRFGKLQKQKEAIIAQAVREKQKNDDIRNAQIRAGIRKGYSNNNLLSEIKAGNADLLIQLSRQSADLYEAYQNNKPLAGIITVGTNTTTETVSVSNTPAQVTYSQPVGSVMTQQDLMNRFNIAADDPGLFYNLYNQTAGSTIGQMFTGYETLAINSSLPNFATMQYTNKYFEDERSP